MIDPRKLLRERGLAPKRSFGQNFLVDRSVLEAISRACVPDAEVGRAVVVELGAGLGALTSLLVERARLVVAVERDRDLVPLLAEAFASEIERGKLVVHEADAQQVDLAAAFAEAGAGEARVLAGNLPYQITGRLLERAVQNASVVDRVVFMVQREVAERLLAKPSTKEYGALSVFTQAAFRVERVRHAPPGAFFPPPEVTSTVVAMTPHRPARAAETDELRDLVHAAFSARRKTLRNAWSALGAQDLVAELGERAEIDLQRRGETLSVEEFARAADVLRSMRGAPLPEEASSATSRS